MAKKKISKSSSKKATKVEEVEVVENKKGKKKKKRHVGRWILISCLLVFIVAPVAFVFGAFYDTSTRNDLPDTYEKYQYNLSKCMAEGFANLSDTNHIYKMSLDENFGNSLMAGVNEKLQQNATLSKFVKKMYCTMKDDKVDFYVDLQLSFFKTRVSIHTTLKTETRDGVETNVFKIDNLKLGRLSLNKATKWLLPKFLSDDKINDVLKTLPIPLSASFSIANFEITYPKEKMKEDLGTILTKTFPDNSIGNILLSLFDDLNPKVYYSSGITFEMDFSAVSTPKFDIKYGIESFNDEYNYKEEQKDYIEFCEECLNEGLILKEATETSNNTVQNLFTVLLTGNAEKKEFFTNKIFLEKFKNKYGDFNSWNGNKLLIKHRCSDISNAIISKTYPESELKVPTGTDQTTIQTLTNFVKNTGYIEGKSSTAQKMSICTIGDDLLSDYFRNIPIIGYNIPIVMQTSENKYSVSMMDFDDMCANIKKDGDQIYVDIFNNLNLNGSSIPVTISTNACCENRSVKLTPTNIYFGDKDIGTNKNVLLEFIYNSMKDGDFFKMVFDESTSTYYFDVAFNKLSGISAGQTYSALIDSLLEGSSTPKKLHDILPSIFTEEITTTINMSKFLLNISKIDSTSTKTSMLEFTFTNTNPEIS